MHKISQAYIVLVYGKSFITELFEESLYEFNLQANNPTSELERNTNHDVALTDACRLVRCAG